MVGHRLRDVARKLEAQPDPDFKDATEELGAVFFVSKKNAEKYVFQQFCHIPIIPILFCGLKFFSLTINIQLHLKI